MPSQTCSPHPVATKKRLGYRAEKGKEQKEEMGRAMWEEGLAPSLSAF